MPLLWHLINKSDINIYTDCIKCRNRCFPFIYQCCFSLSFFFSVSANAFGPRIYHYVETSNSRSVFYLIFSFPTQIRSLLFVLLVSIAMLRHFLLIFRSLVLCVHRSTNVRCRIFTHTVCTVYVHFATYFYCICLAWFLFCDFSLVLIISSFVFTLKITICCTRTNGCLIEMCDLFVTVRAGTRYRYNICIYILG